MTTDKQTPGSWDQGSVRKILPFRPLLIQRAHPTKQGLLLDGLNIHAIGRTISKMCSQSVFLSRFCEWRNKSCNACQCLTPCTQFLCPRSQCWQKIAFVCASSCAVQMPFRQTKNTHSLPTVKKIAEQKFQVQRNGETARFSGPAAGTSPHYPS